MSQAASPSRSISSDAESIKSANGNGALDTSGALACEPLVHVHELESTKSTNENGAQDASGELAAEPETNVQNDPRTITEPRRKFQRKHPRTILLTLLTCVIILAVLFGLTISGVIAFLALNR